MCRPHGHVTTLFMILRLYLETELGFPDHCGNKTWLPIPLHQSTKGQRDHTHFGVGIRTNTVKKNFENSYFIHTGQMRGFASHSANMALRQFSSNCKLFSYSLMMDFTARQKAQDCPVPIEQVYYLHFTDKCETQSRKSHME